MLNAFKDSCVTKDLIKRAADEIDRLSSALKHLDVVGELVAPIKNEIRSIMTNRLMTSENGDANLSDRLLMLGEEASDFLEEEKTPERCFNLLGLLNKYKRTVEGIKPIVEVFRLG